MRDPMELITSMPIRAGKTTAICKAAAGIGATVIVHSQEEAKRIKNEFGVNAISLYSLVHAKGPFLVDTHAVSCYARDKNIEINEFAKSRDKYKAAYEVLKKACEVDQEYYLHKPHKGYELIKDLQEALAIAEEILSGG